MKAVAGAVFLAAASLFSSAEAASQPPIELVVPFTAGGATDSYARLLAPELGKQLNTTIIVVNRPGAGGGVGAASVAKAEPDGRTILLGTISTHAINPTLYQNLPYDPVKDFTPVARVVALPNLLVVNAQSDIKTVADLVAKSKKQNLSFGSSGNGATSNLSGELMKQMQPDMHLTHIPYRGSAPAITDLLGGQTDFQFDNISALVPYVRAGKLRALAVSSKTESEQMPGVKPLAELGFPGYEILSWFGLWLPKGASPETVGKFNDALARIYADPVFVNKLEASGISPSYLPGAEFDRFVKDEQQKWRTVVQNAGLKL